MNKQRLGGGKEVACKRIRGVSCGCALSHASLVAHGDYQRMRGWLVVLCQFEGDLLFDITGMHTPFTCTLTLLSEGKKSGAAVTPEWAPKLMKVCHPSRSSRYTLVFK